MERNRSVKTVIFDIGNVLVSFHSRPFVRRAFGEDEKTASHVMDAVFGSGLWNELDLGVIPEDEVLRMMIDRDPEYEKEIRRIYDSVGQIITRENHAIPWVRAVKKGGFRVLFLSNYSRHAMDSNPGALDFLPLMDGGIFSCDVKLVKPDSRIYRLLMYRYRLNPEECLFIDDNPDNIAAADKLGLNTLRCLDFRQAQEDARDILGLDCEIYE
ncbi:MAG: HAD family hydrolase [Bilifractor sp.]